MALRNLMKVPKLCLVYFSTDKSICIVYTKKLKDKETKTYFTELDRWFLQLSPLETVANYCKQWLLKPMVSSSGSVIEIYAVSGCATHTNFSFDFFPDDISHLNHQEKLFVDDPANADLFDECSPLKPQSKWKHSIKKTLLAYPKWKERKMLRKMRWVK